MARRRQRIAALAAAGLFLLSSVGVSALVIWQMTHQNSTTTDSSANTGDKLQGTQLQGFTPQTKVNKLEKIDLTTGSGKEVAKNATVTVNYTGAVAATGKIFESSLDSGQPVSFRLDQVIKGWGEGMPGMKVGGKRRLIIPAELAYGPQSPSPDIPPNSALVFDIELIAVQ